MSKVLHTNNANNDDYATAIAIPWVFSENSQAKNRNKVKKERKIKNRKHANGGNYCIKCMTNM